MGYRSASDVLPPELLSEIQRYVQGESIYIPSVTRRARAADERLAARNAEIRRRYAAGCSVARLAQEYYLSAQAVYKILASGR